MRQKTASEPSKLSCLLNFETFYISRVLADVALVNVGEVATLRAAKSVMRRAAARIPGAYLIFNGKTRRVVGRLVRRAA
jgi:hypothetical protein